MEFSDKWPVVLSPVSSSEEILDGEKVYTGNME